LLLYITCLSAASISIREDEILRFVQDDTKETAREGEGILGLD